jgi:hypothetical protein
MSTLYYNGIHVDVVQTVSYDRRIVYDGPTYLWTKHRIHVRGVFNPAATSYGLAGAMLPDPAPPPLVRQPGSNASWTDTLVRHYLAQPRKKLIYTAAAAVQGNGRPDVFADGKNGDGGSLVILDCPPSLSPDFPNFSTDSSRDVYKTDANNGPLPLACNVRQVSGVKTFLVEFVVEACVNECFNYYRFPTVMLSHRWTSTHDVDRHGFTTRHVRGHAVFRSDVLLDLKLRPDGFRAYLSHPIPTNFQRTNVRAVQHEDGNRVDYQFVDREQPLNLRYSNVTQVEAFVHLGQNTPPPERGLEAGLSSVIGAARRGRRSGLIGAATATVSGMLPHSTVNVTVRAWGNRAVNRTFLLLTCQRVLAIKFPQIWGADPSLKSNMYGANVGIGVDLVKPYVEINAFLVAPKIANLIQNIFGGGSDLQSRFPQVFDDGLHPVAQYPDEVGRGIIPQFPERGTHLGTLVAQALDSPCRTPSDPPAEPANTVNPLPDPE